ELTYGDGHLSAAGVARCRVRRRAAAGSELAAAVHRARARGRTVLRTGLPARLRERADVRTGNRESDLSADVVRVRAVDPDRGAARHPATGRARAAAVPASTSGSRNHLRRGGGRGGACGGADRMYGRVPRGLDLRLPSRQRSDLGLMRTRIRLLPPDSGMGWTPYAWLIYLLTFFIGPVVATREGGVAWWVWPATILGTLIFLASYFYGYWVHGRRRMLVAALHTALGVAFAPVNPGACVFFVYGASFAGMLHPSRVALRGVVAIALIGGVTALLVNAPLFFPVVAVVISLLVGSVNLHYTQRARVENTLRLAQREIQQLAAIAERERIARDLHDVLGHTLSMIVLKAELAARLAERDPLRAAREMRDVEQVARTTLQDVRLAIRGYRTTFAEELERSRSMLKAAHVAADFPDTMPQLPQSVDETLAFVLREAVTNIV